ncbi:GNAT family N-acetyltransferase [Qipengyuania marisflavi]|uniref:N-acetyltransferase n=1 Tax=Qipengyuania marisflavi TaxID=2486356 RepID=A0A5S3PWZ5_9SPHN|nr:GNAT family N-acetyltransferase [Qipengyuania marisflavi]TMM48125.1 N-acetyltransferase [Qipengyuania marisflavi]
MKTAEIEIERRDRVTHGEYIAHVPDSQGTGKLTWTMRDNVRHAEHTLVPEELRGKGIAGQLVEMLVGDAKREGFKIAPDCSYVAAAFKRNPDWSELLA